MEDNLVKDGIIQIGTKQMSGFLMAFIRSYRFNFNNQTPIKIVLPTVSSVEGVIIETELSKENTPTAIYQDLLSKFTSLGKENEEIKGQVAQSQYSEQQIMEKYSQANLEVVKLKEQVAKLSNQIVELSGETKRKVK
jgi:hypothetical protein